MDIQRTLISNYPSVFIEGRIPHRGRFDVRLAEGKFTLDPSLNLLFIIIRLLEFNEHQVGYDYVNLHDKAMDKCDHIMCYNDDEWLFFPEGLMIYDDTMVDRI